MVVVLHRISREVTSRHATSIVGRPFPTKRAPFGPLRDLAAVETPGRWKVGAFHAAVAIPGRTDGDDVVITIEEIAASGLDYVALGHWHSAQTARPAASRGRTAGRRSRSPSTRTAPATCCS